MGQTTKPLSIVSTYLVSRVKRGDKIPEVVLKKFFEKGETALDDKKAVAETYLTGERFEEAGWCYEQLRMPDQARECIIRRARWFEDYYWQLREKGSNPGGQILIAALERYSQLGMKDAILACARKLADNGSFIAAKEIFEREGMPEEAEEVRRHMLNHIKSLLGQIKVHDESV